MINHEQLVSVFLEALHTASTQVPSWLIDKLKSLKVKEYGSIALNAMLEAIQVSREKLLPICQDTGTPILIAKTMLNPNLIARSFQEATLMAIERGWLRPNSIPPLGNSRTSSLSSASSESSFTLILPDKIGDDVLLDAVVLLRGGGAEYTSLVRGGASKNLSERIKQEVYEATKAAGAKPCPPYILVIGVGATLIQAIVAAYEELAWRQPDMDSQYKELEKDILELINSLDVGPAGLGGPTAIDVWINTRNVHPAQASIAIVFQCWPLRRARIILKRDGDRKISVW